ncbi:hypothetical protein HK405_012960, partial [Cladochytrium tenue]
MATSTASILPPANKGLVALDRALFSRTLDLVALRIPAAACASAMRSLQGCLLNIPRMRAIVEDHTAGALVEDNRPASR